MKTPSTLAILLLVVLSLGACAIRDPADSEMLPNEQGENRARVVEVADALERFAEANHRYPEALAELVPDYLSEEALDTRGRLFEYVVGETGEPADGFRIGFWIRTQTGCVYNSAATGDPWECSSGAE